MLTIFGNGHKYCDGVTRRSFLQVGSLAMGGLALPQLLKAESTGQAKSSHKSVIMVYLSGGLPHQDTVDLKPDAPDGIRGEFSPINSAVPDVQVCELLPQLANVTDRMAILRSIVGQRDEHSSFQNLTGYPRDVALRDARPNFGSVIAKLQGPVDPVIPPFIDLFPTMQHRPYNIPGAGSLGAGMRGVRADGEDLAGMKLRYIDAERFRSRKNLLEKIDNIRRSHSDESLAAMDSTYQKAFDVLTSSKLVNALDVEKSDPKVRERYGKGSSRHLGDGAPMWNDQLLQARQLVEAGVRCVTVAYGFWDTHGNNFNHLKNHLPLFDQGISALIEDIYERGLDKDVTVVVCSEFGRKPQINNNAGRDHWARVNCALMAGGGMNVGFALGKTDKIAGEAVDRPIHYTDILATVYHNLGIEPDARLEELSGGRVPLLPPGAAVIEELVS
ncbi:MAG: DUF1501 domain-containing protein [Planctomycetaceae bacterium]|nr:DUF1501 domain-containing protein [Planctomycetaceae bacterium]